MKIKILLTSFAINSAFYAAALGAISINPTRCPPLTDPICLNIDGGKACQERCNLCGSVPSGCPCAPECPDVFYCVCDSGYHAKQADSGPCTCVKDCATGYYGDGTTCTKCPAPGTTSGYADSITDCYAPKNQSFTDSTGTYEFSSDCKYSL